MGNREMGRDGMVAGGMFSIISPSNRSSSAPHRHSRGIRSLTGFVTISSLELTYTVGFYRFFFTFSNRHMIGIILEKVVSLDSVYYYFETY